MCQTKMQELEISINAEKAKMDNVEDAVLHDFCVSIGVENIRYDRKFRSISTFNSITRYLIPSIFLTLSLSSVYEDRELRIARERDRKRMDFTNQLQRLNNQLEYEKSRDTLGSFCIVLTILI